MSIAESSQSLIKTADGLIEAGHLLEDQGEFGAALERYRLGVAAAPSYARAHLNFGNALDKLSRPEEAAVAYREAIRCDSTYAPARFNLGALLLRMNDLPGAEREITEALRLRPTMYEAVLVLADVMEALERFDDAEAAFKSASAIAPEHSGTLLNYGMFCFRQDRFDEAMALLQRARTLDPSFTAAESALLFSLNFRTDCDAGAVAREHRRVGHLISAAAGPVFSQWSNVPNPQRRLRIGYVSGDFLNHPVALFLRPVLENHDRRAFEVFCLSNATRPHSIADPIRQNADHCRDIGALDDDQVAEVIRHDELDVLVDLSGHTDRNRLSVFARHPAPVQITWLGYLNSTGLQSMDYRICDAHTDPPGETERLYTEKLVRMPASQWCYAPWHHVEMIHDPHVTRPHALVFGSFNQYRKISDPCLAAWCAVLEQLPDAELLVVNVKQHSQARFIERVKRQGIDPARVTMRNRASILDYFATIASVDIALDTFPYNGATTTLDTLWMGVPVIGLRGDRAVARSTFSILRSVGQEELIAQDVKSYVDVNVRLAGDRAWRRRLRNGLRHQLSESPLMDAKRFTRALEARYRSMWQTWCSSQAERI
jgi:predicted O-linked N-acetylglucosamine transferase (SPINDLY family)